MIPAIALSAFSFARSAVLPLLWRGLQALITFCMTPANLVIGALIFAVAFGVGHYKGREKERGIWEAKIVSERRSQNIITAAADAKAARDLQELNDEREILNGQLETLRADALRDANAVRVCLGIGSLHRINRDRKGKP